MLQSWEIPNIQCHIISPSTRKTRKTNTTILSSWNKHFNPLDPLFIPIHNLFYAHFNNCIKINREQYLEIINHYFAFRYTLKCFRKMHTHPTKINAILKIVGLYFSTGCNFQESCTWPDLLNMMIPYIPANSLILFL